MRVHSQRQSEMTTVKVANHENPSESVEVPRESLLEAFSSYTTLHGFHFALSSTNRVRQIIWILLLILTSVVLIYQLAYSTQRVLEYASMVQVETRNEDSITFPAISICSNNMMQKSKILGKDAQRYLDLLDQKKEDQWDAISQSFSPDFDIEKAVHQYGLNLSLAMKSCHYGRYLKCNPSHFTTFKEFRYGLCYTFNSGKRESAFISHDTGPTSGLSITLDAQPEEYYSLYSSTGTGFRVIVHDQSEFPWVEKHGWEIPPGFSTNVRLARKEISSLESPYNSNCSRDTNYASQSYCLVQCYSDMVVKRCGCHMLGMTEETGHTPWCSPQQIKACVYTTSRRFQPNMCSCPVRCSRVEFDVQLSSLYYPPDNFWETISNERNLTIYANDTKKFQEWYRRRVIQLNVFYKELTTEVRKEKEAYTISDLAGDFGGNMGLFLGCSILTIAEFIDLLVVYLVHRHKKRTAKIQ
ncbi:acid-sensing ion channel 3 isoform X2 [Nematostella vectensis]|uniref:acid-sensing ion channel 3 isoform X2 n=1 Tax=Nematostella vectensis TaxID=45351 RepID=UPI002077717F|nr:acid-sensing ion channel 3 isoform X2 [Nematostella vectensis]